MPSTSHEPDQHRSRTVPADGGDSFPPPSHPHRDYFTSQPSIAWPVESPIKRKRRSVSDLLTAAPPAMDSDHDPDRERPSLLQNAHHLSSASSSNQSGSVLTNYSLDGHGPMLVDGQTSPYTPALSGADGTHDVKMAMSGPSFADSLLSHLGMIDADPAGTAIALKELSASLSGKERDAAELVARLAEEKAVAWGIREGELGLVPTASGFATQPVSPSVSSFTAPQFQGAPVPSAVLNALPMVLSRSAPSSISPAANTPTGHANTSDVRYRRPSAPRETSFCSTDFTAGVSPAVVHAVVNEGRPIADVQLTAEEELKLLKTQMQDFARVCKVRSIYLRARKVLDQADLECRPSREATFPRSSPSTSNRRTCENSRRSSTRWSRNCLASQGWVYRNAWPPGHG